MKRALGLSGLILMSVVLSGCGDDAAEEKFRSELIEKALNDDVKKAGEAFLKENTLLEGVVTTTSGLQYKVLKAGEGGKPTLTDIVTVHYEGTTIDGQVFDSSYQRGKPTNFPLNRVIKGWTEGLSLMSKGSEWMLYIPSELAYGATSPSPMIPANSALVFKVELIDFNAEK
jgi:FKBP-type peptidyl-prolyl cis-trans isomerase FkpA/FKBP-type peptidyl-prolyl cis-trans isomerase FklB